MKKYLAEFVGTMVLVFCGCLASFYAVGVFEIAFAFGGAFCIMYYAIGKHSGCHLNPAVSLAMVATRKISLFDFLGYLIAQFAGAFAGCGILVAIVKTIKGVESYKDVGIGANIFGDLSIYGINLSYVGVLIIECVLTFAIVLTFFGVTSSKRTKPFSGLIIGAAIAMSYAVSFIFYGGSANPARSLAPAVLMGGETIKQVWVFLVGPFTGALLAAVVWIIFSMKTVTSIPADLSQEDSESEADEAGDTESAAE